MKKDKARDIARGVLPSTSRKKARDDKRYFHATMRHSQRRVNHDLLRHLTVEDDEGNLYTDPDLYDDYEDPTVYDGYSSSTSKPMGWKSMQDIISERRDADCLGPLLSWARATEAKKMVNWDATDKVNYFKAVLPDTLQGRHALGHIETALDLEPNEFQYGFFNRPDPFTMDNFRANLSRHLSTTKSRAALREAILDAVPVAAHSAPSNLKKMVREQAVDENGDLRFYETGEREFDPVSNRFFLVTRPRPVMVEVPVPTLVSVTCDDCSFLRNDPLATTESINRFVDIVWAARRNYPSWRNRRPVDHTFVRDIFDYVCR